jgi:putative transposase
VQVARASKRAESTIRLWIKRYREKGLAGQANHVSRSDKGTPRTLEDTAIQLIEGLALQTPRRSMAAIHRQVTAIAKEQGWKPPSYDRVRHIIKKLDPAWVTMALPGSGSLPRGV